MIALRGRIAAQRIEGLDRDVWRIGDTTPSPDRAQMLRAGTIPVPGFGLFLVAHDAGILVNEPPGMSILLPIELSYVSTGDVIAITPDRTGVRVLWRTASPVNSVLLTEQCDNFCLMCSQPPRKVDDHWLLEQATELISMLDRDTSGLIFTGGEPTIFGSDFLELLSNCREQIPDAAIHVLTNGRRFSNQAFAEDYAAVAGRSVTAGIPIYGSEPSLHDFIVQADGAFNETVNGILNLAALGSPIELRVVLQKHTAPWIREIADFIARNLPFVDQVALMGLEMTGFARSNFNDVWIDPYDYADDLAEAARHLDSAGIPTAIYNHQLCLLDRSVWPLAVQSISDWKQEYEPICSGCEVREQCCGFFATGRRQVSAHIAPVMRTDPLEEAEPNLTIQEEFSYQTGASLVGLNSANGDIANPPLDDMQTTFVMITRKPESGDPE